jgi:NAD(P)H-hydrate repair Nnr-like enzyme with NAD(P)H-hydrate epimerase domain
MDMGGWSLDQLMELAGLSVSQAGEHSLYRKEQ